MTTSSPAAATSGSFGLWLWPGGIYGFYELNEDHAAADFLRDLFEWELGLAEEVHDWLRKELARSPNVRAAFLTGEVGEEPELVVLHRGESLDVLELLHALADAAQRRFGIELFFREAPEVKAVGWARDGRQPWRQILDVGTLVYRARLPAAEEAHG